MNTTLKALSSLSENSFYGDSISIGVGIALRKGDDSPDQFVSRRLESDQEIFAPENVFADTQLEVHDRNLQEVSSVG